MPQSWVTVPSCTVTSLPHLKQMSDGKILGIGVFSCETSSTGSPKFEKSASYYFYGVKNRNL